MTAPRPSLIFPTKEVAVEASAITAIATAAERCGYHRIVVSDHVLGVSHDDRPKPLFGLYDHTTPFHEPLALLAYLAGITSTVELATGVLVLPQRQVAVVAKQALQIDMMSGGRFVLGVGAGWNYVEYEALGADFESRGAMLDEQIGLLRTLWTEPLIDFSGRFHHLDRVALAPLQDRRIPIWVGGYSPPALRRAAAVGDGFIFSGSSPETREQAAQLQAQTRRRRGWSAEATLPVEVWLGYDDGPDVWAREIELWRPLGCVSVALRTSTAAGRQATPARPPRLELSEHLEAIEHFAEWFREQVGD